MFILPSVGFDQTTSIKMIHLICAAETRKRRRKTDCIKYEACCKSDFNESTHSWKH